MADLFKATNTQKMSKMAYRARILGMCVRVMRSFLFNLAIFFAGVSIGMGFTVIRT